MKKFILTTAAMLLPAVASAQSQQVALTSHIAVQKTSVGPDGRPVVTFTEPKLVTPGDRLAFTLEYHNPSAKAADNFVITDPLPNGIAFADHASAGAEVSVDGGKTFGTLATLKVANAAGAMRSASEADVTHVRWRISHPIAGGERGQVKFEGVVK